MKVVWLERAVADLTAIRAYIAEHNPKAARDVAQKIRKTVVHLEKHPHLGRPTDFDDIREMSVPRTPYLIPYRVKDDRIEILCVFHTSRDRPENWE